jgi:hypothetical protein
VEDLINMLRGAVDQGTGEAVRTGFGIRADVAGENRHNAKKRRWLVYPDAPATGRRLVGRL